MFRLKYYNTITNPPVNPPNSATPIQSRKFNVVIYGVDECQRGTSRIQRISRDLDQVQSVISSLNCSVSPLSIKDCIRLGKYDTERPRPRPLLVSLNRVADVQSILSKRSSLSSPYVIKRDLSETQREQERTLLQERSSLIRSGISRQSIKIKNSSKIFVNGCLWGTATGSDFSPNPDRIPLSSLSCSSSANENSQSNSNVTISDATPLDISSTSPPVTQEGQSSD